MPRFSKETLEMWEGLAEYLGVMREFWAWLLEVRDEPVRRNGYGIYDSQEPFPQREERHDLAGDSSHRG